MTLKVNYGCFSGVSGIAGNYLIGAIDFAYTTIDEE